MTFRQFLRTHQGKRVALGKLSPIADLADDLAQDAREQRRGHDEGQPRRQRIPSPLTPKTLLDYLTARGACPEAIQALYMAAEAYGKPLEDKI